MFSGTGLPPILQRISGVSSKSQGNSHAGSEIIEGNSVSFKRPDLLKSQSTLSISPKATIEKELPPIKSLASGESRDDGVPWRAVETHFSPQRKEREIKLKDMKLAINVADALGDSYLQTKHMMRLSTQQIYRIESLSNTKIFWTDEHGKITLWNEEMAKCTGIPKEVAIGKHLATDLVHGNYSAEVQARVTSVFSAQQHVDFKMCFDANNTVKHMILHAAPRPYGNGGAIGGLFIAEEMMANTFDRKHMKSGTGESLQRLLRGVNVKVFGVDAEGVIDVWNEVIAASTGLLAADTVGQQLSCLPLSAAAEGGKLLAVIDEALAGRETFKYNLVYNTHDAQTQAVDIDVTSRRNSEGDIVGVLCVAQNHAEAEDETGGALDEAKAALARAMEQLEKEKLTALDAAEKEAETRATLDLKRRFVRGVGHEIRTPLNVVFAGLQYLQSRLEGIVDGDILEVISDIQLSCRDAINILDDLLSYEKMDSNLLQVDKSPLDVLPFVQESLRPFAVQAKLSNVTIHYHDASVLDSGNPGPLVEADSVKIGQVMRNLVSNAVKFSKQGGAIDVKVYWKEKSHNPELLSENGWLRVEVTDEGPGISKENCAKLFNNIVQFKAKELQNGGGSGIGLWVSKGIMDLHEGAIGVFSAGEGFGSTFFFEMPLMKSDYDPRKDGELTLKVSHRRDRARSEHQISMSKSGSSSSSNADYQSLGVLIVDDSPLCRTMLKRILKAECSVMDEAETGLEAIDKVIASMSAGAPYDIVLMDGNMPNMGGHEATSIIREKGYKGHIVGVTGDVFPEEINNFKSHGADIVMVKPIDIHALNEYLEGVRLRRVSSTLPLRNSRTMSKLGSVDTQEVHVS